MLKNGLRGLMKLQLNKCKCGKTYSLKEVNATSELCSTCNEKIKNEIRKKDAIRKSLNRDDRVSNNLERLEGIDE